MRTNRPPPNTACIHVIITSVTDCGATLLLITFTAAKIEKKHVGDVAENYFVPQQLSQLLC